MQNACSNVPEGCKYISVPKSNVDGDRVILEYDTKENKWIDIDPNDQYKYTYAYYMNGNKKQWVLQRYDLKSQKPSRPAKLGYSLETTNLGSGSHGAECPGEGKHWTLACEEDDQDCIKGNSELLTSDNFILGTESGIKNCGKLVFCIGNELLYSLPCPIKMKKLLPSTLEIIGKIVAVGGIITVVGVIAFVYFRRRIRKAKDSGLETKLK